MTSSCFPQPFIESTEAFTGLRTGQTALLAQANLPLNFAKVLEAFLAQADSAVTLYQNAEYRMRSNSSSEFGVAFGVTFGNTGDGNTLRQVQGRLSGNTFGNKDKNKDKILQSTIYNLQSAIEKPPSKQPEDTNINYSQQAALQQNASTPQGTTVQLVLAVSSLLSAIETDSLQETTPYVEQPEGEPQIVVTLVDGDQRGSTALLISLDLPETATAVSTELKALIEAVVTSVAPPAIRPNQSLSFKENVLDCGVNFESVFSIDNRQSAILSPQSAEQPNIEPVRTLQEDEEVVIQWSEGARARGRGKARKRGSELFNSALRTPWEAPTEFQKLYHFISPELSRPIQSKTADVELVPPGDGGSSSSIRALRNWKVRSPQSVIRGNVVNTKAQQPAVQYNPPEDRQRPSVQITVAPEPERVAHIKQVIQRGSGSGLLTLLPSVRQSSHEAPPGSVQSQNAEGLSDSETTSASPQTSRADPQSHSQLATHNLQSSSSGNSNPPSARGLPLVKGEYGGGREELTSPDSSLARRGAYLQSLQDLEAPEPLRLVETPPRQHTTEPVGSTLQTSGVAETWEASVAAPLEFGVRSEALLPTPYSPSSSHFLTFPLSHFQFGVRSSEFGVAFGVTFGNQSDVGSVSRTTVHKVIEESQSSGVERRFSETEELNHRQSVHIEKVVQPQSSPETPTELQEAKGQMAESHTVPATPPDAEKAEGSEVDLARVEELRTAGEGGASSQLKRPINQAPAGIRQRSPVEAGLRQRGNEGASNQSQAHKPAASQLRRTLTEPLQQFQAGSSYQTLDDGVTQPIPSVAQAAYAAPPDRTLPGATPDPLWSPLIRGTTELLLNETNTGTDTANAAANAEAEVNRVDIFDALLTPRSAEILSHAVEIDSDNSGAIDSHERELRAHIFNEIRGLHQRRETYKELKIQLTPPHLGRLTVKIGQKEGGVAVRVQASTPEAQQWLLSELSQLEGDLREQGIRLASLDVSVGGENSYYQPQHQRQASFSFNRQRPARWVTGNRAGSIQITELPRFFYADGHLNLAV